MKDKEIKEEKVVTKSNYELVMGVIATQTNVKKHQGKPLSYRLQGATLNGQRY